MCENIIEKKLGISNVSNLIIKIWIKITSELILWLL